MKLVAEPASRDRRWPWGEDEVRAGVVAMAPMLVGVAPLALVLGAAIAAHTDPAAAWAGIWPIFGGSAHLGVLRVVDQGAGAPLAIATGILVHARLGVYSVSLAPGWRDQPAWFRFVAAGLLIDPTWAVAEQRSSRPGSARQQRHHYLGAGVTLAVGWTLMVTAGMLVGHRLGGLIGLDLAAPLCMVALVVPRLVRWSDVRVAAAAGAAVVLADGWPTGTGLMLAIGVGVAVGAMGERPE
jgi:predicted branched-subunit amino acid permease